MHITSKSRTIFLFLKQDLAAMDVTATDAKALAPPLSGQIPTAGGAADGGAYSAGQADAVGRRR